MHSASLFEDTRDGSGTTAVPVIQRDNFTKPCPVKRRREGNRKMSVTGDLEDASMPPLMLNDSFESDDSSSSSVPDELPADGDTTERPESLATAAVNDLHKQHGKDNQSATHPVVEEEEDRAGLGGNPDNSSLELSLLWQPSMPPPTQVIKDSSDEPLSGGKVGCL